MAWWKPLVNIGVSFLSNWWTKRQKKNAEKVNAESSREKAEKESKEERSQG